MSNINKYQKKLNKQVKKKIELNTEEFLINRKFLQPRGFGKSSLVIKNTFYILEQLGMLQSKGYYRWIRKMTKASIKKEKIYYGN